MANEIISTVERIDQVVSTFAKQVGEYSSEMNEQVRNLANAVVNLGHAWEEESYDRFANSINEKISRISAELKASDDLKTYLDQVAVQFSEYLNQLRQSSED